MKLNDFIATEKPWAYNFEFECEDEKYKKLDTFTRYFIYKTNLSKVILVIIRSMTLMVRIKTRIIR